MFGCNFHRPDQAFRQLLTGLRRFLGPNPLRLATYRSYGRHHGYSPTSIFLAKSDCIYHCRFKHSHSKHSHSNTFSFLPWVPFSVCRRAQRYTFHLLPAIYLSGNRRPRRRLDERHCVHCWSLDAQACFLNSGLRGGYLSESRSRIPSWLIRI
jgi:hypothetical protein